MERRCFYLEQVFVGGSSRLRQSLGLLVIIIYINFILIINNQSKIENPIQMLQLIFCILIKSIILIFLNCL